LHGWKVGGVPRGTRVGCRWGSPSANQGGRIRHGDIYSNSGREERRSTAISKDDVQFFTGKERKQIADWKKDDNLFLAILIDDSIENAAAGQWNDFKEFIMAQPATTHIAVGTYATTQRKLRRTSPPTMNWPPKHFASPSAQARSAPVPTWEPWTCSSVGRKPAPGVPFF